MPGIDRLSLDLLLAEARDIHEHGVPAIALVDRVLPVMVCANTDSQFATDNF